MDKQYPSMPPATLVVATFDVDTEPE